MARTAWGRNVRTEDAEQAEVTPDAATAEADTPETVSAPAEDSTDTSDVQATEDKPKRAPRKPIDVGDVVVTTSERSDFKTRTVRMDSNPVAIAVRTAEAGKAYDLHVDEDKVKGVLSILRRSGQRYNVGISIAPEPRERDDDGKVIITFKTGDKRVRNSKSEQTEQASPVAAE